MKRLISIAEITIILVAALIPVFTTLPYRINIFLSWEGAYRLMQGEMPYKDFGIPVGYMYWVIPAVFFKFFGAQLFTLIKAQAFINIIAGLSFRAIGRNLELPYGIRFTGVLVFVLSYSFSNYWPWYNHTVIMYELVALAMLTAYLKTNELKRFEWIWLAGAGIFTFFSFFTKQDGGGLALLICIALLAYDLIQKKAWKPLAIYLTAFLVTGLIIILPLLKYDFGYWFNHGQFPHSSRMSITDIIKEFLLQSQWIKFYLFLIAVLLVAIIRQWKSFWNDRPLVLFTLLSLGILAQAAIFQVTSYVPLDNNIFFHSFSVIYILYLIGLITKINFNQPKVIVITALGILLTWSHIYFRYIERFLLKNNKEYTYEAHEGYNYATVVDRNTYMIELDTTEIPLSEWRVPNLKSFEKIMVPNSTADGIERFMNMDLVKNETDLKVLNMTELTPLAAEVPFALETGSHYPLWFHKGVGMFERETNMFIQRIEDDYYDIVLYEYIPYLNNFYPYILREKLQEKYKLADRFVAPRKPTQHAWVEVYINPKYTPDSVNNAVLENNE